MKISSSIKSKMLRYFFLLALPVSAVSAQAPHTPIALPPKSDSIYRLAVPPSAYPENSFIYLLDDGAVSVNPDGTGKNTYRQVIEILKPGAVEQFSEQRFSYAPGHQRMTINWLRVIRPNGEIVEKPSQIQDSDVPAEMGDPVYSDRKVRRASLTGLEPGALLDYSVTTEELKPFLPGDFLHSWSITTGVPTIRSSYVVDFPATMAPKIKERNLNFKRTEQTVGGRRILTWATASVPVIKGEAFAADSNGVTMSVGVGGPLQWSAIAKWYADNARDRYTVSPRVAAKVDELVRGAHTPDDSIRAIHKWVTQDIRYVSIALGLGGYQPRLPDSVVTTGFGDCKDKATLFITALKHIGVTAYPVLLNSDGNVDRDLPAIEQFDHVIVAIARPDGNHYVDMTAALVPYGELPTDEQGEFGLLVHPDGTSEGITFPTAPVASNREETHIVGTISDEGLFNGSYEERETGAMAIPLRALFENPLDSAMRANLPTRIASNFFQGATGDSLVGFNGKDLSAPAFVRLRILDGKATQGAGGTEIFSNPLGQMSSMAARARDLSKQAKRLFPIDAEKVLGPRDISMEVRVTLPDGWKAKLPANVTATSAFGSYASTYSQNGRELRLTRTMTGNRGVFAPERIGDLIAWMNAVGKDDAKFIILEKQNGPS